MRKGIKGETLMHLYCVAMFAILYYKKQVLGYAVPWYWFALIMFVDLSVNLWVANHIYPSIIPTEQNGEDTEGNVSEHQN